MSLPTLPQDGGNAFPAFAEDRVYVNDADRAGHLAYVPVGGMSLRDYFAGQALAGMLAKATEGTFSNAKGVALAAAYAYEYADAMLKAREGK